MVKAFLDQDKKINPLIAQINADVSILIQRARFILNKLDTIPTPSLALGHPTTIPVADIINATGKRAQIGIMGSVTHIPTLLGVSSCQLMTFEFFIFFCVDLRNLRILREM